MTTQPEPPPRPQPGSNASHPPQESTATDADAAAADPAVALADVWNLLDVLPAATSSSDMMASTIEMAAVSAEGRSWTGSRAASGPLTAGGSSGVWRWLPAAAFVLASLVTGIAIGRATAPAPDATILANLPVVQHLDLLREAGSVAFLEAVAKGGYPPPRRPPPAQSRADVREDAEEFDAAIAALRAAGGVTADRETIATRREQVAGMSDAQRRQLERSAETFQRLTSVDRSDLVAVGRALADPSRRQLLEAARLWHLWVRLRDPADRRDVIELSGGDRLEWLDRWTRIDARQDSRTEIRDSMRTFFERERDNRRRPPPEFPRGGPEFRQGHPDFREGPPPGPPGSPPGFWRDDRPPGPPGKAGPPDPPRPRGPGPRPGPPVSDREPPSPEETPEPPR